MLESVRPEHTGLQFRELVHCSCGEGDAQGAFAVAQLPSECLDPLKPKQSYLPPVNPKHLILRGPLHPVLDLQSKRAASSFAVLDCVFDLLAENNLRRIDLHGSEQTLQS